MFRPFSSYFFALAGKSLRSRFIYRTNLYMNLINGFLMLFVQASVWQALYSQGQRSSVTLEETLTYVILSSVFLGTLRMYPGRDIGDSVYNGNLGIDLLRPVNLQIFHIGYGLGRIIFVLASYTLPVMLFALLFYGILPPASIVALAGFMVTGILGVVIFILFDCIVGYSAFWLMNNWFMGWFEGALLTLFGGTFVPLWFYPEWILSIADYLPFKYINFASIDLFLGRTPASEVLTIIGVQLLWICILLIFERLVWYAAQKKIIVQGG